MQILTDSGYDLSPEQLSGFQIHQVPLFINLNGTTYRSGIDITIDEFYQLLAETEEMPTTSLPSPGDFVETYQKLSEEDPDILSVHISSGLSSTFRSAKTGADMVPEAKVTVYDTKTLSVGMGWHVEAAARMAKAGWPEDKIIKTLDQIHEVSDLMYTLPELKYLIHGGRISHIKGLVAQVLRIKPLISVGKEDGKYYQKSQQRTFKKAMQGIVSQVASEITPGTPLRVQVAHANNPDGADQLQEFFDKEFECKFLPHCSIAPVLGAHTGPGLVGAAYAPLENYPELP
ncbi:MAG: DegV family EDD domain-containing protein [Gammaproteobacteria bacterium]|nr:DegV family EDD domain-containing protein [Gammaproteobacteria bacterium]